MPTIQCLKVIYYFPIVNDGNIVHTDFTWDRQCCSLGAFARLAARFHFLTKSFLLEVQQSKTFQVIHDTTTTNAPDWDVSLRHSLIHNSCTQEFQLTACNHHLRIELVTAL